MFKIGNKSIGNNEKTFIVAEIGANHNGDLELAKRTIKAAAECGVDAVKFQTYTSQELLSDKDRIIEWEWNGGVEREPISEMFDRIKLDREEHIEVFKYAKSLGLIPFSTPFSISGVKFLAEDIGVPCFKVAASDVNYIDMLLEMARYKIPIMLSLGKCTLAEADIAITTLLDNGVEDLIIMHCVSQYPSPMEDMNLKVIESLKLMYPETTIGFSDHSIGTLAAVGAVVLGAKVVEKHFTLDNNSKGPDHWFSLNPSDMKKLVIDIRDIEVAMGSSRKRVLKIEEDERYKSIRSISISKDVLKGHIITEDDLKIVRPGWGISPYDKNKVLGMEVKYDLLENTVLEWKYFK